jgi:Cu2+-exporting ATPase
MALAELAAPTAATNAACSEPACFHCGLALPARPFVGVVARAERRFCCTGCLAIALTIHEAGLDAFYASRTSVSAKPREDAGDDEWTRYDDAAVPAGFVREVDAERAEASLLLDGMSCGACIWLIEAWLLRQPGIERARVNFSTRRAQVVWKRGEASLATVLRAIVAIGYRACPYDPGRRETVARRERRSLLARMAVALLAMMQVMMFAVPAYLSGDELAPEARMLLDWASFTLTLPVLLYSAAPIFRNALRDVRMRSPGMDVPVALGLGAAFVASTWSTLIAGGPVYYDSVTMFVALLLVARYVELVARHRAGDAIEAVARHRPTLAERIAGWPADRGTGTVPAATLARGDHVLVRPGATVPADGDIVDGSSHVQEQMLTGESEPRARSTGQRVLAGAVNGESPLVVRVTAAGAATQLAAVLRLTGEAADARPRVARLADRVATWFVGALLLLALVAACTWWLVEPTRALAVTVAVLVVSCPCALSLATPSALAAAAGALSRRHVVLATPDAIETLARVTHIVFDKTGTLTTGAIALIDTFVVDGSGREEALACAAALEASSEHRLGRALVDAAPRRHLTATDVIARSGRGVEGTVGGCRWRVGSLAFVSEIAGPLPLRAGAFADAAAQTSGIVALGSANGVRALFVLGDDLRPGARAAIDAVREMGLVPILMSGDRIAAAAAIGRAVGIDDCRGELLPKDKMDAVRALQSKGAVVAMVGDGVNDAPGLAHADVSISLGSATPVAQWNADVVVLCDELSRIAETVGHARRTLRVIRQNLAWAFGYNLVAIPLAAFGLVTPVVAAIGMSLSSVTVVLNALRAGSIR